MGALYFASCDRDSVTTSDHCTSEVILKASVSTITRSSLNCDADAVRNLSLYFFNAEDGSLTESLAGKGSETYKTILKAGTYNVYALANTEESASFDSESDIRRHTLKMDLQAMQDGIPMCWKGTIHLSPGQKTEVYINLERLISTIWFSIDMGLVEGLEITSMKLCQAARTVRPFSEEESRALDNDDITDGDYATGEDLAMLMSGESMRFYVPENCQGVLLPENTDPWAKVPDNIKDRANLCSYIEMKGRWKEDAYYAGEITYRFYLGEDPYSSFDVRRNTVQSLVLCPDETNFDKVSWKIDTSGMDVVQWNAEADLSRNFHKKDNFHITEIVRADIALDRRAQKYWKARPHGFGLKGVGKDGRETIRFGEVIMNDDGTYHTYGTCIAEGDFDLVIYDCATEEIVYLLDSGKIIPPYMVIGNKGMDDESPAAPADQEIDICINGERQDIYIYLTDSQGYNLNRGGWYGCDFSICRWETATYGVDDGIFVIKLEAGSSGDGGYAARCSIRIPNDGTDIDRNRILSRHIGISGPALRFGEETSGTESSLPVRITCEDINITVRPVAEEAQARFKTDFMYVVENPSNLPVRVRGIRLNSVEHKPTDDRLRNVTGWDCSGMKATGPLVISKMPETICSFCQDGPPHLANGEEVWFAASEDGISQTDMPDGQSYVFLVMEAKLAYPHQWSPKITGQIETSGHDDRYGKLCGMYFYAGDSLQDRRIKVSADQTDFTSYGNILDRKSIETFNEMAEVNLTMNVNNEVTATASEPTYADVDISGTLYGHIRCITIEDPFDIIWGHYFRDEFHFAHKDRHLISSEPQVIDDSCLAEALVRMRNEKYYSALDLSKVSQFRDPPYPDKYGTIREYLKPYDLCMSLKISSADGTPVAVSWNGIFNYEYTISDPVTWPKGLFSYITIVPSTYSGYDRKVDEDGCPPGRTFIAERVTLDPEMEFGSRPELFLLSSTSRQ